MNLQLLCDLPATAVTTVQANADPVFTKRAQRVASLVQVCAVVAFLFLTGAANAQGAGDPTVKDTAISIFLVIYGVVGVFSAIMLTWTGIAWMTGGAFFGRDPKAMFFNVVIGTVIALGCVAGVQWVKTKTSSNGAADINNL